VVFWIGTDVSEELAASIIGVDYCVCCSVLETISDFIFVWVKQARSKDSVRTSEKTEFCSCDITDIVT